ncbi:hypothetical protein [Bradyrhizobium sp.]
MTTEFPDPTAASAAVPSQLAEKLFAEESDAPAAPVRKAAEVKQHPGNAPYRSTVEAILPAIKSFAAAKNVPIEPHELELVADVALGKLSRKTMRGILCLNADAIRQLHDEVDRVLDAVMLTSFCATILALENRPVSSGAVYACAERSLNRRVANDAPTMKIIWPSVSAMVEDYYACRDGSGPFIKPLSGMVDYGIACIIQRTKPSLEASRG